MKKTHTEVIRQLTALIHQLSPQQYAQPLPVLNGSSIGQHTRHVLEFFQCLMKGYENGVIDYDARERNFLFENDLHFMVSNLETILAALEEIPHKNIPLLLAVCYESTDKSYIETNLQREMAYLVEHSIHHFALIRIGLQQCFPHVQIPAHFGMAYSTLQHREAQPG